MRLLLLIGYPYARRHLLRTVLSGIATPGGIGVCILYCSAFAGIAESTIKDSAENAKGIVFMIASFVFERLGLLARNPSKTRRCD